MKPYYHDDGRILVGFCVSVPDRYTIVVLPGYVFVSEQTVDSDIPIENISWNPIITTTDRRILVGFCVSVPDRYTIVVLPGYVFVSEQTVDSDIL